MVKQKTILIIDDEPDIVNLTDKFLKLEEYDTLKCENGRDALEILKVKHEQISLVLLDIMLPEMSGYEILTQIKSKYPNILVVLFTVKNFNEDIIKGKELGADGYLVKAISGKELLDYVKGILNA